MQKLFPLLFSLSLHLLLATVAGVLLWSAKTSVFPKSLPEITLLEIKPGAGSRKPHAFLPSSPDSPHSGKNQSTQSIESSKQSTAPSAPSTPTPRLSSSDPENNAETFASARPFTLPGTRATNQDLSETASYLAEVRAKIEESVEFPESLQRRKLYGQVNLRVTLLPDGSLSGAEVLKSSGFAELDDLATGAVKKAAPYASYERRLQSDAPLRFQVPLVFKAEEN